MPSEPDPAVEAARRAVYRPGATEGDVAALQRAQARLPPSRATAPDPPDVVDGPSGTVDESPAARQWRAARPIVALACVGIVCAAAGFAIGHVGGPPQSSALAVLDRPQRQDDLLPTTAERVPHVPSSATRLLRFSSTTGAAMYGARRTDGSVCLITVVLQARTVATCTSRTAFAYSGLSQTLWVAVDPTDDSAVVQSIEITPTWSASGAVAF